jgi:6-phosphogluconolactonase
MGTDGHTASFFPDADGLDTLLDPAAEDLVLPVHARSAGEPRLTLSLPAIAGARMLALHIEGEGKRGAFEAAFASEARPAKPIRTVIEASHARPTIFWAPSEGTEP